MLKYFLQTTKIEKNSFLFIESMQQIFNKKPFPRLTIEHFVTLLNDKTVIFKAGHFCAPFYRTQKNSRHLRQLKRRGGWNVKIWAQCKHGANSRNITTNIWQKIMPWHICKLDSGSTLFLFVNRHISSHSVTSRTDTLKRKAKMLSRGA